MSGPILQLFDVMLAEGASDLHLSVGYPPMLRLSGELQPMQGRGPVTPDQMEQLLWPLVDEHQKNQFLETKDLDFAYGYEDKARFRANYLWKTTGPGAVFRTIPSKILTAEQLGLPPSIITLSERRAGLVLVTGPTGSGKSTTLAAMINHINETRAAHILTIEDPVEFVHQPKRAQVTHREVGEHTPSFADAIRSAGRENADVILVGELRGQETMRMALQLASFGVLVFATVHTNSATATIDRFINTFPNSQQAAIRGMLSDALAGIVAQQLLRRCDKKGRIAAHEILIGTTGVCAAIRESKIAMLSSLIQTGQQDGMQSMDATLDKLVRDGKISARDALDKALDKESFAKNPAVREQIDAAELAADV